MLYYLLLFENTCFGDFVSYLVLECCFGGAEALCIIVGGRKQPKQVSHISESYFSPYIQRGHVTCALDISAI